MAVGAGVGSAVGVDVGVGVGSGVGVAVWAGVGSGVGVPVGVGGGVGAGSGVAVGADVAVGSGVGVAEGPGVGSDMPVGTGVEAGVADTVVGVGMAAGSDVELEREIVAPGCPVSGVTAGGKGATACSLPQAAMANKATRHPKNSIAVS